MNAKTEPRILRRQPFLGLHPEICRQEARSAPLDSAAPRQAINVPPPLPERDLRLKKSIRPG